MTTRSRRHFLRSSFSLASAAAAVLPRSLSAAHEKLHIGVPDWTLNLGANPDAIALAARIGFQGIQISFGRKLNGDKMPLDNPDLLDRYLPLAKEHNVVIDGTCVDRLHDNGLKSDKLAPRFVSDSIRLTKALKTQVLLLPFFGKWAISNEAEMDYVGDALRELGPEAEKAGVILGLENTISAKDNVRIMDRSRSKHVKVYYDVGNSFHAGFDPVREIRWLGKERICQFHLKDDPHFLGEGDIDFTPIMHTILDMGFSGWANLETASHSESVEADLRRNLMFVRDLVKHA